MKKNLIFVVVGLVVAWFLTVQFIAPLFGIGVAGVSGILLTVGLVYLAKSFGLVDIDPIGLSKQMSMIVGVLAIVFVVGIGTILGGITGFAAAPAATISGIQAPAQAPAVTLDACSAQVDPEIRGTASTADLNAYDWAQDSPLATAVDVNPTVIYKTGSTASSDQSNYISTATDTTAGTANLVVGEVYTFVGGSSTSTAAFYMTPSQGVCVKSARVPINLQAYAIANATNMQSTVYDSTGATALAAGGSIASGDYQLAMGASEETAIEWKIKVNAANQAYWLTGISTAVGANMTWAKPTGSSIALFTQVATPEHLRNQKIDTDSVSAQITTTRSYNVYKLNQPVLLLEFEDVQYRLSVKSSSSNPIAANATETSFVALLAKDGLWVKGQDGKPYFDIHDRTSSEANVGLAENATSPAGKAEGVLIEID